MMIVRQTLTLGLLGLLTSAAAVTALAGQVEMRVTDDSGIPLPCRVHLYDAADKPVKPPGLPFFRDHFVTGGTVTLELPAGSYRYEIARGPEYQQIDGQIEVGDAGQPLVLRAQLQRLTEIRKHGWYSADLHIHRPLGDIEQLMLAEDLDYGPVISWWNKRNPWRDQAAPKTLLRKFGSHRLYHIMAGEDEREGGALLYFGLKQPIEITKADREHPSPLAFAELAELADPRVWIDIEKPFWWDTPVWLASGKPDSIGIANNHMNRRGMYNSEAWGRPRDKARLPNPLGNGFWTQEIYYHILNTGLRIPPSAGSASGVLPNPVGYNRVYVQLDNELTEQRWWEGLRAGRCFVTNGPILLCRANDRLPGHVFREETKVDLDLRLEITSADKIKSVELIHNGRVRSRFEFVPGQPIRERLTFAESGWFLVRALVDDETTFRFASTGPYYLEIGSPPVAIRQESVQFFRDWVQERISRVEANVEDSSKRAEVLKYHYEARQYWQDKAKLATDSP